MATQLQTSDNKQITITNAQFVGSGSNKVALSCNIQIDQQIFNNVVMTTEWVVIEEKMVHRHYEIDKAKKMGTLRISPTMHASFVLDKKTNLTSLVNLFTNADPDPHKLKDKIRQLQSTTATNIIVTIQEALATTFHPDCSDSEKKLNLNKHPKCKKICAKWNQMHDNFISHRDVKPANLMFDTTGEAYIIDWGASKNHTTREIAVNEELFGSVFYPENAKHIEVICNHQQPSPRGGVYRKNNSRKNNSRKK